MAQQRLTHSTNDVDKAVSTVEEKQESWNSAVTHTENTAIHVTEAEKTAWNGKLDADAMAASAREVKRTNITNNMDLNTLDMGAGSTASDYKLFVSTSSAITKTLLNLPPDFAYSGFSLEYIRISGQQWLQRITGATYSSTGNVTTMTIYYRAGVGQQPDVTWGGWFMLAPTACSAAAAPASIEVEEE